MSNRTRPSAQLLEELHQRTIENLSLAKHLRELPDDSLNQKPGPHSWNAVECLAHLNHFGTYYLPEIRRQIKASKHPDDGQFTTGWLGDYFANMMHPGPTGKDMKTLAAYNPVNFETPVDRRVIDIFMEDQLEILELIDLAGEVSLTKTKTGISITQLIRLRLGDTLRVVVNHNWRHLEQALRAVGQSQRESFAS